MQTDRDGGTVVATPVSAPDLAMAPGVVSAPAPPPAAPQRKARPRLAVAALLILVIGAGIGVWFAAHRGAVGQVLEASGTVEATDAVLGFAAGGRIRAVAVREGEPAVSGAVLAELDTSELMAHVRQLRDQTSLADAQLRDLQLGSRPQELDDRRQAVIAARQSLDDAERDLGRMTSLLRSGAISQQTFDKAKLSRDVAATQLAQAQAALSLATEGARRQQIVAAQASLASAHSQLEALQATIPNYFVRAPWSGLVTDRAHEPGEAVSAGMAVLAVMNPQDRWVRIYVPESDVGAIRLGQRATITSDAFPDHPIRGHVRWISSEAEFTPRNVQTKDDRVRLVYAAKVQIDGDSAMVLKPGTPADVRVELSKP